MIETRRRNHPHLAKPFHADTFWQNTALSMVGRAIRKGVLPKLDGTIACVDCTAPATVYEHRDYGKPLDVEPVCQSCNKKRGTPIWPHASQFNFRRIGELKAA
jgi:hypothetical protein